MNEPEPQTESDNNADRDGPRLFPKGFFDITRRIDKPQKGEEEKKPADKPNRGPVKTRSFQEKVHLVYLRWWGRIPRDRRMEFFLTLAITYFAWQQWHTSKSNNESTSQQTDQLIAAAKYGAYASNQNALAAQSFADSARKINGGIGDAVNKLNLQAGALENSVGQTSRLADASTRNADLLQKSMQVQQRPWVGISEQPVITKLDLNPWRPTLGARIKLKNSGSSPAFHVLTAYNFITTGNEKEIDFVGKTICTSSLQALGGRPIVRIPNVEFPAPTTLDPAVGNTIFPGSQIVDEPENMRLPLSPEPPPKLLIFFGCAVYKDEFETTLHWTRFCIQGSPQSKVGDMLRNCPNYNDTGDQELTEK